jgi:hypothetical protein
LNGQNYKVYFNSYARGTEITIRKIAKPFSFLKGINLLAILTRVFETVDKQKTKTFPDQSLTLSNEDVITSGDNFNLRGRL